MTHLLRSWMIFFVCLMPIVGYTVEGRNTPASSSTVTKKPVVRQQPAPSSPIKEGKGPAVSLEGLERPSLVIQGGALVFMSLLPFFIMILTSFVKIVVVLSLLRSALGVQQAPPNQVINGVAFLLSIYVMFPTGVRMYDAAKDVIESPDIPKELISADSAEFIIAVASKAREPMRDFLKNNSLVQHQRSFYKTVYRLLPDTYQDDLKPDDFLVCFVLVWHCKVTH